MQIAWIGFRCDLCNYTHTEFANIEHVKDSLDYIRAQLIKQDWDFVILNGVDYAWCPDCAKENNNDKV